MNALKVSLFFLLSIAMLGCGTPSSNSDHARGGKADDLSGECASCQIDLDECIALAEDGSDINSCLAGFAGCYVETTSQAIPCPEGQDCSPCGDPASCQDTECLVETSECILVALDLSEAAQCPAPAAALSCNECEDDLSDCFVDAAGDDEASAQCVSSFSQCVGQAALAGTCGDGLDCGFCEIGLKDCEENAQDGSDLNICLAAFSACYVEAKGTAIECPEGEDCSACEEDCDADDTQCLKDQSSCLVVGLDLPAAAQCEPVPLCSTCESELQACLDDGQDEDFCLGGFSACHVDATQSAISCPAGADCSLCDDIECGPNADSSCLKRQSFCVVVQAGHGQAATCPE